MRRSTRAGRPISLIPPTEGSHSESGAAAMAVISSEHAPPSPPRQGRLPAHPKVGGHYETGTELGRFLTTSGRGQTYRTGGPQYYLQSVISLTWIVCED